GRGWAEPLAVGRLECLQQFTDRLFVARSIVELIGVGPAVGGDGERLASPDDLAAALAEVPPAAQRVLAGSTVGGAVPALHRVHTPAVADGNPADCQRLRERRALSGRQRRIISRQFEAEI